MSVESNRPVSVLQLINRLDAKIGFAGYVVRSKRAKWRPKWFHDLAEAILEAERLIRDLRADLKLKGYPTYKPSWLTKGRPEWLRGMR